MEVQKYVFQSPYSSAVQVGRLDPASSDTQLAVDALASAGNETQIEAESYKFESTLSSVNVAISSTDSGVSSSLDTFSTLNTQVQASQAYSS